MKAIEDKDVSDVIVCNLNIFDTLVHALIDPGSTHSYVCTSIPSLGSILKSETEYDILVTNPVTPPKYTLVVFDMFRVFCKPNLTVS